ncbi:hypothetical protein LSAT2_002356 [Lamellibrachia satsuma]|nr:hypothetical protein LSAT2_002356 [Lamellibrachia satsuma]
MESRARSIVFWPGISTAIHETRDRCRSCNKTAPSKAATPPAALDTPSTPFESVFADFCDYGGCHYLVVGDRLSGWVDIYKTPPGTPYSGATGLIACLRQMFATFGVPEILSSDGGPEFTASETSNFLSRWGIHHRISSVAFLQSNGRAELAVKKAKRTLMDNIGPTGSLDNDGMLRAMLQLRNTPDPDCLSVDANHGRLYYSNMGTTHVSNKLYTWHRIETIKFDGTGLRTVVTRAEKLRALWIYTSTNHLYYTSWGPQAFVVRTNLNGTEPSVLLQNMDNPNGLAVGPADGKLYVVDSHDKTNRGTREKKDAALYESKTDGQEIKEVSGVSLELPFGLAVSSDTFYISDWTKNAILSVSISGHTMTTLMSDVTTPMALFFTPATKSFSSDTCRTSGCGDICLATPGDLTRFNKIAISNNKFQMARAGFTQSRWTGAPSQQCFIKRDTSLTAWRWTTPTRNCSGQTSAPGPSPPWISVGTTVPTPRYWLEETERGNRERLMCMLGSSAKPLRYISATHIYSLYAAHDFLWYTDWNAHSLSRVNVKTGYIEVLATGLMRPSQIVVHYDGSVPAGFECRCPDGEMLSLDKAQCETVVSKYVEVDPRHCVGVISGHETNQVCGRKIGSTDVECVCKAGHGVTNCDACPENKFSAGVGKVCKSCPASSHAYGTGNTRCVCSDNNKVCDWKLN